MQKKDIIIGSSELVKLHKQASSGWATAAEAGLEAGSKLGGKVKGFFGDLWGGAKAKAQAVRTGINESEGAQKALKHVKDNRGTYGALTGGTAGAIGTANIYDNKLADQDTRQAEQFTRIMEAVQRQKQMHQQQLEGVNDSWANRGIIDRVLNRPPGQ